MIKGIYGKPRATIRHNGETRNALPLMPATRQVCLLSPSLLNILLEVRNKRFGHWKENKTAFIYRQYDFPIGQIKWKPIKEVKTTRV